MKTILKALNTIVAITLCWQGMNELYKFERCDYFSACYSFFLAFIIFLWIYFDDKIKQ